MRLSPCMLPICDKCNKQVDKMEAHENFATYEIYFIAHCHGEKDICNVSRQVFLDHNMEIGRAFITKKINSSSLKELK